MDKYLFEFKFTKKNRQTGHEYKAYGYVNRVSHPLNDKLEIVYLDPFTLQVQTEEVEPMEIKILPVSMGDWLNLKFRYSLIKQQNERLENS